MDKIATSVNLDVYPRFSHAIRAYTQREEDSVALPSNRSNAKSSKSTYANFKEKCLTTGSDSKLLLEAEFNRLEAVAKEFAKQQQASSEGMADYACIHLLWIFYRSQGRVRNEDNTKLLTTFGPFAAASAKKAASAVQLIRDLLGKDVYRKLLKSVSRKHVLVGSGSKKKNSHSEGGSKDCIDTDSDSDGVDEIADYWGKHIQVQMPTEKDLINFEDYCFRDQFRDLIVLPELVSEEHNDHASGKAGSSKPSGDSSADVFSVLHVINALTQNEALEGAVDVDTVWSGIYECLKSKRSDDLLQGELFDFLGFDKLDLIEKILKHREALVYEYDKVLSDGGDGRNVSSLVEKARQLQTVRVVHRNTGPVFGQQITVQSEREKMLLKVLRKEEKRIAKLQDKFQDVEIGSVDIDILRQREIELSAAKLAPIFDRKGLRGVEQPLYPHVYDGYRNAIKSSAFIAGNKMVLPAGFTRKDSKVAEEITIAPSPPAPTSVGKNRIKVEEVDDDVFKAAFRGTKELNRIQSVVFPTAYKTNNNLLICAPTGAGKTNIAMLCVLHEIKKNIEAGVIKKDKFKIVYVAPMKALAAEMVRNFGKRLEPLGITVKELTGDMQLTKVEIMNTQMLVTTPEKWDVVTRKSTGDVALSQLVKLLIIDEIHLLHDDRGSVIETLVARTLRQAEFQQTMIRIVGLSATLPNYVDVARFLSVNPEIGLFFFDGRFRPVPLGQKFIGVKATNKMQQITDMDQVCFDTAVEFLKQGHQVMVFVHARNATSRVATVLKELASNKGMSELFRPEDTPLYGQAKKLMGRSRNKMLKELFDAGLSIHHAGLTRPDRNIVEKLFGEGHIRLLCCTATLAWGVNLPAHAVVIRGTEIYDAKKGMFVDLGILDVQQIFGRAGRPQFDTEGYGVIITAHDKLAHYLSLLTRQMPIESQLLGGLMDSLNAEVCLGTVTSVDEAVEWLSYTYLYVRMRLNPLAYGVSHQKLMDDPDLTEYRKELIKIAASKLDQYQMIRFDDKNGYMFSTQLGRIASHYYIRSDTIETFNEHLKPFLHDGDVFSMVAKATEFQQLKIRDDEMDELDAIHSAQCRLPVAGGTENAEGKVNVLLQAHISQYIPNSFSLISDSAYVMQNAQRILRAVFEMCMSHHWSLASARLLTLCKVVEQQFWPQDHPIKQFYPDALKWDHISKLDRSGLTLDDLKEMDAKELGYRLRTDGKLIKQAAYWIPRLNIAASIQPITRTVLRVKLEITADFNWNDRVHGKSVMSFWIWVEDPESNNMYHSEFFLIHKKQVVSGETQSLVFTIPIREPLPTQYCIRCDSERFIGSDTVTPISFKHLILPERYAPNTELLDINPLPVTALRNRAFQSLYKFSHFNAIQTQMFFALYHTDENVLVGAPTGSGKTIAAEIAMFRVFRQQPGAKCVYVAPLKALVRERIKDWKIRLEKNLNLKVVELTGDVTPDAAAIAAADVIVTTPEKWDGISRSWQTRNYVRNVALIVIDEIHLLGEDRGPVLEVIVSRTNFIRAQTDRKVRVVGLSTALANARDLADWLGIKELGLYNFKPAVRPVPLEVHVHGFPGKHYCPRMATMNKPSFQAIKLHSPTKPVLIFVSSRRQTRLTALDLITYLAGEGNPKMWCSLPEQQMEDLIKHRVKESNLKLTLAFGIGLHHAGLHETDRNTVEELFVNQKIQILIATSTLAWGVNFPAHLVIIKGTEYYDGKTKRYVDFPITDVLQMMGRAGRPQFDDQGVACVFVQDTKKDFYKRFLYEPFPVESSLLKVLSDHLNAEIVAGTINSKQEAMDYITWTYFFRRLLQNPSYYDLENPEPSSLNGYLTAVIDRSLNELQRSYCIEVLEDNRGIASTTLGRIASYYYLHHSTVKLLRDQLGPNSTIEDVLKTLTSVPEYDEIPVRHNEDHVNEELAKRCRLKVDQYSYDDSHTKAHLLYQAHFARLQLPSTDYLTDLKSVLDQSIRILQAMLDVSSDQGWLATSLHVAQLLQMIVQARWHDDHPLSALPNIKDEYAAKIRHQGKNVESLPELMEICRKDRDFLVRSTRAFIDPEMVSLYGPQDIVDPDEINRILSSLPVLEMRLHLRGWWDGEASQKSVPVKVDPAQSLLTAPWIPVHANQEYLIGIELHRVNSRREKRIYAPRFPKAKDEGWFLMLGCVDKKELLALKRHSSSRQRSSTTLLIRTPETTGRMILTVFLISDSYISFDQQFDIHLDVIPESLEAQLNSELE